MKHYTDTKFCEWLVYEDEVGRNNPRVRKAVSEVKRGYRRRERAALKRGTAELVAVELDGYREAERAYWWGEYERSALDYGDLEIAEEYLRESGQWTPDHTRIFAAAYREIRERSEESFAEWAAA